MHRLIAWVTCIGLVAAAGAARQQTNPPAKSAAQTASPAGTSAAQGFSTVKVEENVLYANVNGSPLYADVYEPSAAESCARPGIVLIHGGGWTDLDKSTMRGMGNFLARNNIVGVSVDYRLLHAAENRWPAQLDDVQRAVRWLRANATKYGVNPDRLGAFGHSAGAQLAALVGMEETRDNSDATLAKYSSKVQAVVDVSGPTDFTTERDPNGIAFLTNFFGIDYAKGADVWRQASPALQVSPQDSPFLIFHGTQDENVPMAQAQELYDKLRAVHVPVDFVKVDDGHTFQTPQALRELALKTLAFFQYNLEASHEKP